MAIVSWPTADAVSYITLAAADTYFSGVIYSTDWDAATDATKEKALVTATRIIDRQTWAGTKVVHVSDLEFPRTGLSDKDGLAVASDAIPQVLLDAVCELANALISDSSLATHTSGAGKVKNYRAGDVAVTYRDGSQYATPRTFPRVVGDLIGLWIEKGDVGAVYGNEDENGDPIESEFTSDKTYDVESGIA